MEWIQCKRFLNLKDLNQNSKSVNQQQYKQMLLVGERAIILKQIKNYLTTKVWVQLLRSIIKIQKSFKKSIILKILLRRLIIKMVIRGFQFYLNKCYNKLKIVLITKKYHLKNY